MLKLNHKLNQGKKQLGGQFRLPSSLNGPSHKRQKWIDETVTKEVEYAIGHLFIGYLRQVEKRNVLYFSPNPHDDHGNPDLHVVSEGKRIGVQVVQFVIRNYLERFSKAKSICEELSDLISNIYRPPFKVNIQICTPWDSDEIPKGKKKLYRKLAKTIAESIERNVDQLRSDSKHLDFNLSQSEFKDIAESYHLSPVTPHHQSNYFGDNNIYIDYGFDYVVVFEEDIKETAKKIFDDKNNGNSEILVIWGDENHFLNTTSHIISALEENFKETSFESVYFLSFYNLKGVGERRINYAKIK